MKQPWWAVFWARLGVGRRVTCLQRWNEGVGWGSSWTQTHPPTHSRREMHRHWNLGWPSPAPVHAPCGVDRVDSPPTPSPCICPAGLAVWTLQAGSQAWAPPAPCCPRLPWWCLHHMVTMPSIKGAAGAPPALTPVSASHCLFSEATVSTRHLLSPVFLGTCLVLDSTGLTHTWDLRFCALGSLWGRGLEG